MDNIYLRVRHGSICQEVLHSCLHEFVLCPSSFYFTLILFRVETQDGGDAKVEVSPRDIVYMENAEPINGEQPEILHKLDLRYACVLQTIH